MKCHGARWPSPRVSHKRHKKFLLCFCAFCGPTYLWLGFVGDFEFLDGNAVAPDAHEALLRSVAEGVLAVLADEGGVRETVKEFPGAVEVEGVHQHRLGTYASRYCCIANWIRSSSRRASDSFAAVVIFIDSG